MIYGLYEEEDGRVRQLSLSDTPVTFADLLNSGHLNGKTPRLLKGEDGELAKLMSVNEIQRKDLLVADVAAEIRKWRESGLSRGPQMEAAVTQLIASGSIRP